MSNVQGAVKSVPVWVYLSNIPMFVWSTTGINWLASRLGRLVCLDENTEKLQRIQYAKCLIEVPPVEELVDEFMVKLPDGGIQVVKDEYRWKLDICSICKCFGHNISSCDAKECTKEK